MDNEITVEKDFDRIVKLVENVYEQVFKKSEVLVHKKGGGGEDKKKIFARNESDEVMVTSKDGTVEIDMMLASDNIKSKIMERLDVGGKSRHTSGSGSEDERQSGAEMNVKSKKRSRSSTQSTASNGHVETFDDGSIRFLPAFTKDEAEYDGPRGNTTGNACKDCAHYIEGGGCHIVRGDIDPQGVCQEYYADIGAFFDNDVDVGYENPLLFIGEDVDDWTDSDILESIEELEDRLQDRL